MTYVAAHSSQSQSVPGKSPQSAPPQCTQPSHTVGTVAGLPHQQKSSGGSGVSPSSSVTTVCGMTRGIIA